MKRKPITIEEWLEANNEELRSINEKLDRRNKPSVEDMGLIDSHDLCGRLNISAKTLATWRKQKKLPYTKIVGRYFYRLEDVKRMLYEGFGQEEKSKE